MALKCPVCKAENSTPPTCRRCKADLSLVFALERDRAATLARARSALAAGRPREARTLVAQAELVREDEDSARLAAVAALLAGDSREAWTRYSRLTEFCSR